MADEIVAEWLSEWAGAYDQKFGDEQAASFVGKRVVAERITTDGEKVGFAAAIIGWTKTTLTQDGQEVFQWSLVTDEGQGFPIFAGMKVKVDD